MSKAGLVIVSLVGGCLLGAGVVGVLAYKYITSTNSVDLNIKPESSKVEIKTETETVPEIRINTESNEIAEINQVVIPKIKSENNSKIQTNFISNQGTGISKTDNYIGSSSSNYRVPIISPLNNEFSGISILGTDTKPRVPVEQTNRVGRPPRYVSQKMYTPNLLESLPDIRKPDLELMKRITDMGLLPSVITNPSRYRRGSTRLTRVVKTVVDSESGMNEIEALPTVNDSEVSDVTLVPQVVNVNLSNNAEGLQADNLSSTDESLSIDESKSIENSDHEKSLSTSDEDLSLKQIENESIPVPVQSQVPSAETSSANVLSGSSSQITNNVIPTQKTTQTQAGTKAPIYDPNRNIESSSDRIYRFEPVTLHPEWKLTKSNKVTENLGVTGFTGSNNYTHETSGNKYHWRIHAIDGYSGFRNEDEARADIVISDPTILNPMVFVRTPENWSRFGGKIQLAIDIANGPRRYSGVFSLIFDDWVWNMGTY